MAEAFEVERKHDALALAQLIYDIFIEEESDDKISTSLTEEEK